MPREIDSSIRIRSVAFGHGGHISPKYTCEGENVSPPLEISNIPPETKALALIMDDPDAPRGVFCHWLMWNIPPNEAIGENSHPGVNGKNSFDKTTYGGPCPPSGSHRYYFKVYALDAELGLPAGAGKNELEQAMQNHILASGELMAHYQKKAG